MTSKQPILEGSQLTKSFDSLVAVDHVDFTIEENEILGLIGPNGSGKTTLINVVTGTLTPDSGNVYLSADDITGVPQNEICRKGLTKTHQVAKPIESMTVKENVVVASLFGNEEGYSTSEANADANRWLEFVDMREFADDRPSSLTHSELRKLELARALATRPTVLCLDEVAAGLSKDEIRAFMDLIEEIRERLGLTILWIEHIVEAVMQMSDRMMVLNHGEKIAEGTPQEVADDPQVQKAYLGRGS